MDAVVGENVRRLRLIRGYSQESVASAIGVTFQQIQKYEKGDNRLSGARIVALSKALECSISDFFKGTEVSDNTVDLAPLTSKDMEVVHTWKAIICPQQRKAILHLMRTMAQAED